MTGAAARLSHRFCVAPMMDWTDRHDRFFLRLISRRALLFTEMLTAVAVIRGDRDRLLGFSPAERPLVLQLGGADPAEMAEAARIAEGYGYDGVNINVGCPSDRVQSGRFGACLMAEPALVAECVAAMRAATTLPVTVKSRIGIDEQDEETALDRFVDQVAAAGCTTFIVHARKAWLKGLSPAENRDIPPLNHCRVHRLKQRRPELEIVVNGGLRDLADAEAQLAAVDGVMLGRAAYQNPYLLAAVDRRLFGEAMPVPDRAEIVEAMLPYLAAETRRGTPLSAMTRHMLGLYQGLPGARAWRRTLAEGAHRPGAGPDLVAAARDLAEGQLRRHAA